MSRGRHCTIRDSLPYSKAPDYAATHLLVTACGYDRLAATLCRHGARQQARAGKRGAEGPADLRRHSPAVQPGTRSLSIVVPGNWNPAIFSAGWLLSQALISVEDLDESEADLIAPGVAAFHLPWVACEVTAERLHLACADEVEFLRTRDLAVGILRSLAHTPIAALGINVSVHLKIDSVGGWHRVGDRLAPKDVWTDVLHLPGTRSLTVLGVRPDEEVGHVQVTVEPSQRVPLGVFVQQNDHFALRARQADIQERADFFSVEASYIDPVEPSRDLIPYAVDLLVDDFDASLDRATEVFGKVAALAADA